MIPHPDRIFNHGEDALFMNENLLVVADGVVGRAKVTNYLI